MGRKIMLVVVLTGLVLVGVLSMLSVFNFTSTQPSEASNLKGLNFTGVTETKGDALVATGHVTGQVHLVSIEATPTVPGDPIRFQIMFTVTGTAPGTGGR